MSSSLCREPGVPPSSASDLSISPTLTCWDFLQVFNISRLWVCWLFWRGFYRFKRDCTRVLTLAADRATRQSALCTASVLVIVRNTLQFWTPHSRKQITDNRIYFMENYFQGIIINKYSKMMLERTRQRSHAVAWRWESRQIKLECGNWVPLDSSGC